MPGACWLHVASSAPHGAPVWPDVKCHGWGPQTRSVCAVSAGSAVLCCAVPSACSCVHAHICACTRALARMPCASRASVRVRAGACMGVCLLVADSLVSMPRPVPLSPVPGPPPSRCRCLALCSSQASAPCEYSSAQSSGRQSRAPKEGRAVERVVNHCAEPERPRAF